MPDHSTADTAGTAETVGTAAASDITRQVDALLDRSTDGIVMDEHDDAWRVTAHLATHGDGVPATGRQRDAHVLHVEHRPLVHGLS